jgi:large subunit ribosomal protein L13
MKTYSAKTGEVERKWWIVDLDGKVLGRAASEIAKVLRGKNKPQFTPHIDTGDFVVVINADKVHLTGNKIDQKMYYRHSGFHSGLKQTLASKMIQEKPEYMIRQAVWGMLPKNRLGRRIIKKLKIYRGAEHPHGAQQPSALEL